MRISPNPLASVVLAALLVACADGQREQLTEKFKAVMAVHDEMMAYMGPMSKAKRTFTHWADSLGQNKKQEAVALELRHAADTLAYADRIMHIWMQEFDADYDKKPAEEAMRYLDAQIAATNTMKQNMRNAIAHANAMAEKHKVPAKVQATAADEHSGHQH